MRNGVRFFIVLGILAAPSLVFAEIQIPIDGGLSRQETEPTHPEIGISPDGERSKFLPRSSIEEPSTREPGRVRSIASGRKTAKNSGLINSAAGSIHHLNHLPILSWSLPRTVLSIVWILKAVRFSGRIIYSAACRPGFLCRGLGSSPPAAIEKYIAWEKL